MASLHQVLACAVRTRLRDKGVDCPVLCMVCDREHESIWHALINCTRSQQCMQLAGLWSTVEGYVTQAEGFTDLFFMLANALTRDNMTKLVMVLWSIWGGRNAKLWSQVHESPEQIVERARSCWGGTGTWRGTREEGSLLGPLGQTRNLVQAPMCMIG